MLFWIWLAYFFCNKIFFYGNINFLVLFCYFFLTFLLVWFIGICHVYIATDNLDSSSTWIFACIYNVYRYHKCYLPTINVCVCVCMYASVFIVWFIYLMTYQPFKNYLIPKFDTFIEYGFKYSYSIQTIFKIRSL